MTTVPSPEMFDAPEKTERDAAAIENLFLLGSSDSPAYTIYKDDKGQEIKVQFRSLMPYELQAVSEAVSRYVSPIAQLIAQETETLARAITYINGMPLVLSTQEREEHYKKYNRQPSPLDMAKIIINEKIKSEHILDAMYDAYQEFITGIRNRFEDIKKKLKEAGSSSSTSPS